VCTFVCVLLIIGYTYSYTMQSLLKLEYTQSKHTMDTLISGVTGGVFRIWRG